MLYDFMTYDIFLKTIVIEMDVIYYTILEFELNIFPKEATSSNHN